MRIYCDPLEDGKWFEGIIKIFERERKEYLKERKEIGYCEEYQRILGELSPLLLDSDDNLLSFKIREIPKHLRILHFMIMATMYPQSIRELRYMLESIIQAYYIDTNHPNTDISFKLEILKEIHKISGSRLIKLTDLKNQRRLIKIYGKLSSYIHSSYEKNAPVYTNNEYLLNTNFGYSDRMFKESTFLTKKTIDVIFFVILSFNKDIIPQIKEHYEFNESLNDFELTSGLINE